MIRLLMLGLVTLLTANSHPILNVNDTDLLCPNVTEAYREFSPATLAVSSFSVSPDGTNMLLASPVGLYWYNPLTLEYLRTMRCEPARYWITWSSDSSRFALYYSTCIGIEIWETATLTVQQTLTFPEDSPYCADPNPLEPYAPPGWVDQLVWSPDSQLLAARGTRNVPTRVWDLSTGGAVLVTPSYNAAQVAWSPDSGRLAYVHDCVVEEWRVGSIGFEPLFEIPCTPPEPPFDSSFNEPTYSLISWSITNKIAVGSAYRSQHIYLWDAITTRLIDTGFLEATNLVWNPDGTVLAAVIPSTPEYPSGFHNIIFLDEHGELISRITSNPDRILEIAWHPDGEMLYVLSEDNVLSRQLRLHDVHSGEVIDYIYSCVTYRADDPTFDCENFNG